MATEKKRTISISLGKNVTPDDKTNRKPKKKKKTIDGEDIVSDEFEDIPLTKSAIMNAVVTPLNESDVEKGTDCFGNFSEKEVDTCGKCGMNKECNIATKRIEDKLLGSKSTRNDFLTEIKSGKNVIADTVVKKLINEMKTKETSVEIEKMVKKVKKIKSTDSDKKVKHSDKTSKADKVAKAPKKAKAPEYKAIEGTFIPVAFKDLFDGLSKMGKANNKASITTFTSSKIVDGKTTVFVSIPKGGVTEDKVALFLNRSVGYTGIKSTKHVEVDVWPKEQTVRVNVTTNSKSISETLDLIKKWKSDFVKHVATKPKAVKKGKAEKATKSDDKVSKKIKHSDKAEKGGDKSPPVIKPKKKGHSEDKSSEKKGGVVLKKKGDKPKKKDKVGKVSLGED